MRAFHLLLMSCLLLPQAALAQVYKCTGKDGRVTYSQTPPKEGTCKENQFRSTDPTGADAGSLKQFNQQLDAERQAQAQSKELADREAAEKKNKETRCSNARSRLAFIEQSTRLAVIDESGQRQYQDEAQKARMKAEAQALIAESCN